MANEAFTEVQTAEDKAFTFELSGNEVHWLVDGLAIERARAQGHELGEILSELEVLDTLAQAEGDEDADVVEVANDMASVYPAVARLLWLGMIRFNEDVTHEALLSVVGPGNLSEIPLGELMQRLFPEADEEAPTEGK